MGTNKECCGLNFIKNAHNVFNIIFLLAGLAVLGVAIWTMVDRYQYVSLLASVTYPIIVYFLLGAGSLVVFVAFMGCYAVLKEHRPLLLLYIFLLLLIFLMEAMVGMLAYIYRENVDTELKMSLNSTFLTKYKFDDEKTEAIDYLQENFRCCGADSFSDWQYSDWIKITQTENKVPDSCCKTITEGCGLSDHPSNINYAGCSDRMSLHLQDHLIILSAVGLGICFLQIFGIVFACKLYFKLKRRFFCDSERNAFL